MKASILKQILIYAVSTGLILTGCRTIHPINPDDIQMKLTIEKSFITGKAAKPRPVYRTVSSSNHDSGASWDFGIRINSSGDDEGAIIVLLVVVTVIIFASAWHLGSCRVYMIPEGYPRYKQQLYWGENTVFLPKGTTKDGLLLNFETYGRFEKQWQYKFTPGEDKGLLLRGDIVEERIILNEEDLQKMFDELSTVPEAGAASEHSDEETTQK